MAYSSSQARQKVLDDLAQATDEIGAALALLGEAYELLDEHAAERLEEQLFRPVQLAYGRARRTHSEFAQRHDLPTLTAAPQGRRAPSAGARGFIDGAMDAAGRADATLAALQDSMLPVEVGDPPLRAGLAEVRQRLGDLRARARELERTLGR